MKLKAFLTGVFFAFSGLVAEGQIRTMLYQGFEEGEVSRISVSLPSSENYSTTLHSTGSRSLELGQSTQDVEMILDTLDFTTDLTVRYVTLEFDHICKLPRNTATDAHMGRVYFKRANQSDWTLAGSMYYNMVNGGTSSFQNLSSFSIYSYPDWNVSATTNEMWRSERFDFNTILPGTLAPSERKVLIKFVIRQKTSATATAGKWHFDNIKVTASSDPMVRPVINMACYPDGVVHPSSRGARIELDAVTSVSAGINPDSVYLYYRVGSDPTPVRLGMVQDAVRTSRYRANIPFFGYDTMMAFYCVARDATSNANMVRFPQQENSWVDYYCVRGGEQPGQLMPRFTSNSSDNHFPFRGAADGRSEWVYDSALLAESGYGPGTITALRYTVTSHTPTVTRPNFQIRMKNAPTNYEVDTSVTDNYPFTLSYMHVVYDSAYTVPETNGGDITIVLQDSFYYAGKDLVMQCVFDGTEDVSATNIRAIPIAQAKKPTIWFYGGQANFGYNAFTDITIADWKSNLRPSLVMTEVKNLPLLYDMGVSELVSPSYETPMTEGIGTLTVKLKNFGAEPVNGVRISYLVDDTIGGYYDWSGTLAGGATQNVQIANNVNILAGFHTLKVWVEDTLTVGTERWRDHEPYNDTAYSEFIVCAGPMNGVRQVGGAGADFNTMAEMLFALSRCGIDDSLIVKLAPGEYEPFVMPQVQGVSASHYLVFEPLSGDVRFVSDVTSTKTEIVNLEMSAYVRFRNINFVRRGATATGVVLADMVKLGMNSVSCRFEGCSFIDSVANPSAMLRINSLLNSGFANGLTVDGCTFVGGKLGVDLKGIASDVRSTGNTVKNSLFRNQYESALSVQNQTNVVVERNEMYDVLSNTSYVLLVSECYGQSRVTKNKIYTSHGAGAMGVSKAVGVYSTRFLIANNMIVCEDDGTSNLMRSPMNIIQANYADVVYNSVKMTAGTRSNIAAATFGGGVLQNSRFLNNIVVCLDNSNYALNYVPASETSNEVGHNIYFSYGQTMNRKSGGRYVDMAEWLLTEPNDTASIKVNPNFLNGSLVDLRTFNRQVKGIGIPLATVPTDMFDTLRSTTATCPGAFEFVSLGYDFEPEALVSPEMETCNMPTQVELVLRVRNNGTSIYNGSGLTVSYQVNGGSVGTRTVTQTVPADDTVTIHTGAMLSLPSNGTSDALYSLKVWTNYGGDPNATNDTNTFAVLSKYHPVAPSNVNEQVQYATQATITPTAGVDQWSVYTSPAAPTRQSQLYWYHNLQEAEPFFVGPTLTTDTLRQDTSFYFRQKRAQPMVRITQLEYKRGGTGNSATIGETPNAPFWLNASRKVALQLTNIGDERACLYGDTVVTVSPTGTFNNKIYRFADSIYIEPGQSLVLQYVSGNSLSPANTLHTGLTFNLAYNTNIAFLYKHGGVIEDAVVMNSVTNHNAPAYVWSGAGKNTTDITDANRRAGLVRTGFAGGAGDWRIATNEDPMMLASTDEDWIVYTDNGCDGEFATVMVTLLAPPVADIEVGVPQLPATGCGMGMEEISVPVRNYGVQPVTGLVLNYNAGGTTVSETVAATLPANGGGMTYTFSTPLNLAFPHDSLVNVTVWANAVSGDPVNANDTNRASVMALHTPAAPAAMGTRTVQYAERDTVTDNPGAGLIPVWYDYEGNAVDTGYTHITDILYAGGTMGVSHLVTMGNMGQVGSGTGTNGNAAFPSPYQPGNKYAKQQYIYTASELRALGFTAGYIDSIAFDLTQMLGNRTSVVFDDYYISMGLTSDTIFSSTSAWKSTGVVFHSAPFTVYASDCNQWKPIAFDTPFYWDGQSSVVVQVVHYIATKITTGVKCTYTTKANTTLHKNGDSDLSPSTMNYVGAGTRGGNRPNIRFYNTVYGCEGPVTPYTVQLVNIPSVDVAIMWPDGIDTIDRNSCDSLSFYVKLRNQGASDISSMKLYYTLDNLLLDSVQISSLITPGTITQELLLRRPMAPGRHQLTAVAAAAGDNIVTNDTVRLSFVVRFCGGTYTIAPTNGDYHSFGEAIDTLNAVGIEGPVTFNVMDGIYNEQVILNNIPGASSLNTISFVGMGDSVYLIAANTQNDNYVFFLDSASNVTLRNIAIEARPTGNSLTYGNALVMQKGSHITIDGCRIKVKSASNNNSANASCVVLGENMSHLTFTNNIIDSGFYAIKSTGTGYENINISNNQISNFWKMGVNLRSVTNLTITSNDINSGVIVTGRGLRGLYLALVSGTFDVEKNHIYLIDSKTGGKLGIQLENVACVSNNPGLVANNMISCYATGTADLSGLKPAGIWIDSSSSNINVLFNTVRVQCGNVSTQFSEATVGFFTGATVSNIQVMNNIFSNFAKGYAYYVTELNTVNISNFNAYFTESTRPFFWKQIRADLVELQNANTDDANSVLDQPYFNATDDLHLAMTNFVSLAQYTTDVIDDIDGTLRSQIPPPTIGAHEMEINTHDMAIVEILSPYVPADTNFSYPNKMPVNIEGDSVLVKVRFYNNGRSLENNVQWYAYIEGHEAISRTPNRNIGPFNPAQMKIDSVMMPTALGIINRHTVHVVLVIPNDAAPEDNDRTAEVFLAPAYNFQVTGTSTASNDGCGRRNTTLQISVKNVGFKDMPVGMPVKIGFHPQITQPANTTVSTMPDTIEANVTLPNTLLCNQTTILALPTPVNLYPTGLAVNLKVKLWGWCHNDLDVSPRNDTTTNSGAVVINSYYTPAAPVGYDTTLAYGTWGGVRASQVNNRPVRWYRDSTASPYYHPTQYAASCRWNNTPQYFHDTTYYLNCLSDQNCPSFFSPVTVHVAPRIPDDMAMKEVLAPLGGRVYMQNDTVRVVVSNYGTSPLSNIPITYQLKRGTATVQTVTETITATVPAGQDYTYTFDSLLIITTPTTTQNYTLNIWTDLPNDGTRRNDTLRTAHTFRSLAESTYEYTSSTIPTFDITRASFNEFDFDCPALGRGVTNLASFSAPDYPVVHVNRGLADSLIVQVTPLDGNAQSERVLIWALIDFDRNGLFEPEKGEAVISGASFYDDATFAGLVRISNNASYGYMRMRIAVGSYADFSGGFAPTEGFPSSSSGHFIDFLLHVDPEPPTTDLAVTQIVAPRSYLIDNDSPRTISFRIANKGTSPLSNPQFTYRFQGEDPSADTVGTVSFGGTLQPGTSGIVTLPAHVFPYGVTTLNIFHHLPNDEISSNDSLVYEYNRFHVIILTMDDNFESDNKWYAPTGYNAYSRNYWELGTPTKAKLNAAYSDSNAWVTDLDASIVTGKRGNVSYLYSPIIKTTQIRTDTISFYLRRNLTNGSSLHLEFCNFAGRWVKVDWDSATNWYNNVEDRVFDGTTAGSSYTRYWIPTIRSRISGDFPEYLQFRLAYTTPIGSSTTSAFGEGCAVDNFRITRAPIRTDGGVIAITKPVAPCYGQTIYPEVVIKNYGTDTIRQAVVGYTHYGTFLPKMVTTECSIPPGYIDTIAFDSPFIVTSDFPDTFYINAFTKLDGDIYRDNDTLSQRFSLAPLENDISAHSFVYPLAHVIAGDTTVQVTMRVRNFGRNPIYHATATYMVNGRDRVDEDIDFVELLGEPLSSMQYFNYTFHQNIRATMGIMNLVGIIKSDSNDYIYNDTITKRIEGISAVNDIAAVAMIVDSSGFNDVHFELVIENRGARGANGFEVGFYIDNDSSVIYRETYGREQPLPALTTGYHMFDVSLPRRPAPYNAVTAFVHLPGGDNDPSNDTTSATTSFFLDIEPTKVLVEETAQPDCRVFLVLRNNGNLSLLPDAPLQLRATINGTRVDATLTHRIEPGQTVRIELNGRIPKSPTRSYAGTGRLTLGSDGDMTNNETNVVEVVNHVEGVPTVESSLLSLEQNYPNPFSHRTTVPFALPEAGNVRFFVIDAMGHIVNSFSGYYDAGEHSIVLDMEAYSSGVYYYGIEVNGERRMRKMIMK